MDPLSDTDSLQQHHVAAGDEIPAVGEVEGREEREKGEMDAGDTVNVHDDPNSQPEGIEEMKKRLKEIEDEAGALRRMRAKVEKEMAGAAAEDPASASVTQAAKEEADSRSIYVGNVDYACTPEEVQQHFQSCGTVNRVTILTDKFGQPKGFAYVEFVEVDAVQNALLLNESELHGRQLKVSTKRTNVPGIKQYRARRSNPFMAMAYSPPPFYSPYGFGKAPRFRRPMRFRPYY